jgi:hypothetical protein
MLRTLRVCETLRFKQFFRVSEESSLNLLKESHRLYRFRDINAYQMISAHDGYAAYDRSRAIRKLTLTASCKHEVDPSVS